MKLITDVELRAMWSVKPCSEYEVEENTIVTPAARDFLKDHGISLRLVQKNFPYDEMPRIIIPPKSTKGRFIEASTGTPMDEKPEDMTHLRGNILVPKNSSRIAFRGKLDSLEAKILETQIISTDENLPVITNELEELYGFVRTILGAEVNDTPLGQVRLLGMDSDELRHVSHNVQSELGIPHLTPSYKMGKLSVALNSLRTAVRETEIAAAIAFCNEGGCKRLDIIGALNRLSSCVYIIYCRKLAGKYGHTASAEKLVPVEFSSRHVHLNKEAIEVLFGKEAKLSHKKNLSQPGEFLSEQRVKIVTNEGTLTNVAVLGPERRAVQVELSISDARSLGIRVPVNVSGDLSGAADVILVGPCGIWQAKGAAIASKAHVHMTPEDADSFGVKNGSIINVVIGKNRPVTIESVVRVSPKYALAVHIDTDEASACAIDKDDKGRLIVK